MSATVNENCENENSKLKLSGYQTVEIRFFSAATTACVCVPLTVEYTRKEPYQIIETMNRVYPNTTDAKRIYGRKNFRQTVETRETTHKRAETNSKSERGKDRERERERER